MFAFGFLLFGVFFLLALWLVSLLLPKGKWRAVFIVAVLGFIAAYPFLHRIRPSYAMFKQLCAQEQQPRILRTKEVDFILLESGYSSDCTKGPEYISKSRYLGFDCNKRVGVNSRGESVTELTRYVRRKDADASCGLECFTTERVNAPETQFGLFDRSSRTRAGYLAGDQRVVTMDYPQSREDNPIPFWRWLRFSDFILVDKSEGDMAYTTRYYYLPYGPLTVLGMASGSAPSEQCPMPQLVDPRQVYKPKAK